MTGGDSFVEGLAVHIGDHQEAAGVVILRDDGDDAVALGEVNLAAAAGLGRSLLIFGSCLVQNKAPEAIGDALNRQVLGKSACYSTPRGGRG